MSFKLKCDKCGKKIESLSLGQVEQNMKVHKLTHDKKKEVKQ